jgi:hypothetical protein
MKLYEGNIQSSGSAMSSRVVIQIGKPNSRTSLTKFDIKFFFRLSGFAFICELDRKIYLKRSSVRSIYE